MRPDTPSEGHAPVGLVTRRSVLRSAVGGLAAAPFLAGAAHAAPIALRFGHANPITHPFHIRLAEAAAAIAKASNGEVKIDIFPNTQLGGDNDMMDQVRSGALDFCSPPGQVISTILPVISVTVLGFLFPGYDHIWPALDGKVGDLIRQQLPSKGLVAMDKVWDYGFKQLETSTRPVHTPDDLVGMKVRVPTSPVGISLFKALGASPVTIQINDTYTALQTHLVDGLENQLPNFLASKFYEVQKYGCLTNHSWDGPWICASAITWNGLPADVRTLIADHLDAAGIKERQDLLGVVKSSQDALVQHGMVFNTVDPAPFRAKLRSGTYYADWRAKLGDEPFKLLETYIGPIG
jgi:tripartite ATP-independent transporter DctP family solute receptor